MEPQLKRASSLGNLVPGLAFALLICSVYSLALQNGFTILDDPAYVTDNPVVKQGPT